jgi:thiamine biosynthesis lipoprotein
MSDSQTTPWRLIEQRRRLMGTSVSLHLAVPPHEADQALAMLERCWLWLEEVEARLTRFRSDSELWQMNRAAGTWFDASETLFACMTTALRAAEKTAGLFDPTLLDHLEALGYDRDFDEIARREVAANGKLTLATGRWREIDLDAVNRRIRMPQGVRVDLGGIAKGWAADVALDRFFAPCGNVIVNLGGDMRLRGGPEPGKLWAVGVDNPRALGEDPPDYLAVVTSGMGGIATSGAGRRWWLQNGAVRHHLIDPRTGEPARIWTPDYPGDAREAAFLIAAATALAPTAAQAEIAAKVALLQGFPQALEAVEQAWKIETDSGVALIVVLGSGEVHSSINLEAYLQKNDGRGAIWLMPR